VQLSLTPDGFTSIGQSYGPLDGGVTLPTVVVAQLGDEVVGKNVAVAVNLLDPSGAQVASGGRDIVIKAGPNRLPLDLNLARDGGPGDGGDGGDGPVNPDGGDGGGSPDGGPLCPPLDTTRTPPPQGNVEYARMCCPPPCTGNLNDTTAWVQRQPSGAAIQPVGTNDLQMHIDPTAPANTTSEVHTALSLDIGGGPVQLEIVPSVPPPPSTVFVEVYRDAVHGVRFHMVPLGSPQPSQFVVGCQTIDGTQDLTTPAMYAPMQLPTVHVRFRYDSATGTVQCEWKPSTDSTYRGGGASFAPSGLTVRMGLIK
jgi:hypothetical protein